MTPKKKHKKRGRAGKFLIPRRRKKEFTSDRNFNDFIKKVFKKNKDIILKADEKFTWQVLRKKVKQIMTQADVSAEEALRALSRTRLFTSEEEHAVKNIRENVYQEGNEKLLEELRKKYGGRVQWSKLKWDEEFEGFRLPDGTYLVFKDKKSADGYRVEEVVDIVSGDVAWKRAEEKRIARAKKQE